MSKSFFRMQLPLMLIVSALMITLVAWKEDRFAQQKFETRDTIPNKKDRKVTNIDEAIEELEKAQIELERSIKNMPIPSIDVQKMQIDVQKAMKEIDVEKIKIQIDQALKEFNPEKIKVQMDEAMKQIDVEKIKASMAEAMKEFDAQKIKMQVQEAMAKIDLEKMKAEIAELNKTELPKIEAELKNLKPQIEAELEKAKTKIQKAKKEMKDYKAFEEGLEKDGLINKKEGYTIEHKEGQLIINGKIQSQDVYNKYRSFLDNHKKFKLEKDENDFNLNVD